MSVIDDYLQKLDLSQQEALKRIRKIAKEVVPEAEDVISYGMPTLKYKGKSFLGFDAHMHHIGIYPYGGVEIEMFKKQLQHLGYAFSKGTIQAPYNKPFPQELLKKIILQRIKRIA